MNKWELHERVKRKLPQKLAQKLEQERMLKELEQAQKRLLQATLKLDPNPKVQMQIKRDIQKLNEVIQNQHRKRALEKPPGKFALNFISKIVSKKKFEKTFEPLIADWQEEYFQALDDNEGRVKLFFINLRHRWALAKACGLGSAIKFGLFFYKAYKIITEFRAG